MNKNILIPIVFLSCFCCSEQFNSHFQDYNALINSKSWQGNWIPKNIPNDASNIYESHNIDLNAIILKFTTQRDMKIELDTTCKEITNINDIKYSIIKEKWWPNPLYGKAYGSSNEYWYYKCQNGYFAVAFLDKNTTYYWRNEY